MSSVLEPCVLDECDSDLIQGGEIGGGLVYVAMSPRDMMRLALILDMFTWSYIQGDHRAAAWHRFFTTLHVTIEGIPSVKMEGIRSTIGGDLMTTHAKLRAVKLLDGRVAGLTGSLIHGE